MQRAKVEGNGKYAKGLARLRLDGFGTPAGVGLAHVGGGLDGGDEFEGDVGETDDADDATRDDEPGAVAEDEAAAEDVDWRGGVLLGWFVLEQGDGQGEMGVGGKDVGIDSGRDVQRPRPMKEKRNEA